MKSVIKDIIKEVGSGGEIDPEYTLDSFHSCRYYLIGIYESRVPNIDQLGCGRDVSKSGGDILASKALRPKCANQRVGGFSLGPSAFFHLAWSSAGGW